MRFCHGDRAMPEPPADRVKVHPGIQQEASVSVPEIPQWDSAQLRRGHTRLIEGRNTVGPYRCPTLGHDWSYAPSRG